MSTFMSKWRKKPAEDAATGTGDVEAAAPAAAEAAASAVAAPGDDIAGAAETAQDDVVDAPRPPSKGGKKQKLHYSGGG